MPLLQIAPSKTDTERLLVVIPELADVLSSDHPPHPQTRAAPVPARGRLRPTRTASGQPPAPLLFQRRIGTETAAITADNIRRNAHRRPGPHRADRLADRRTLHYTSHDFRRMFITDAILNGLPPHIAQVIAGHRDINITMGYKAVYPDEAIQAHLAFLARRRALRPTEEYRDPTDEEWQDFLGHFERRKLSTGTCGRAFGTPCIHEHAPLTALTSMFGQVKRGSCSGAATLSG